LEGAGTDRKRTTPLARHSVNTEHRFIWPAWRSLREYRRRTWQKDSKHNHRLVRVLHSNNITSVRV